MVQTHINNIHLYFSVDSLLQIHAVYNLIDIMSQNNNQDPMKIDEYKKESVRLEWKYMEKLSISV